MRYTTFILTSLLQSLAAAYPAVPAHPTVSPVPVAPAAVAKQQTVQIFDNCLVPGTVALTFDDGIGGYEDDLLQNLGNNKATFFTIAGMHEELERLEEAFIKILGKPLYYRAPWGEINDEVASVLTARNYTVAFHWSDDSGDATVQSVDHAKRMYDDIAASWPEPHMVLSHSTKDTSK
ncbi:hypothetical protein QFC20_005729 [Naganishia adeliensis]|uniref:Uncharacterized protein n=1 Tax=Naganishia adeliensis TaxID=92952 RepID=A0ACC2VKP7_9TREE|nr:hypothetical protein QFC20_005729 [Naganishia adeliensis]